MRWNCKRPIFNFLVPPAKDLGEEAWGLIVGRVLTEESSLVSERELRLEDRFGSTTY